MHDCEARHLIETDNGTYCKLCYRWHVRRHVTELGCTLRTSTPPPNLDQGGKMLVLMMEGERPPRTAEVYLDPASIEFLREAL